MTASSPTAPPPTTAGPWWHFAPNPPCQPWCDLTHEPGDFGDGGILQCRKVMGSADWFNVAVVRCVSVDVDGTPGVYELTEPAISAWMTAESTELTLDEYADYAFALASAVGFARWLDKSDLTGVSA